MSDEHVTYLDSSAIVKLVVLEAESYELRRYLSQTSVGASSALAIAEVSRAAAASGRRAAQKVQEVLAGIDLIRISDEILHSAAVIEPSTVRSLDAIHLATAASLEGSLAQFVCYDRRLCDAARAHGWSVHSPA